MSSGPDWGIGAYEVFAPALAPSAEHLVQLAAPRPGERAIDLGCGHGNATLPLLESGAHVTAVDPSSRLLGIASARAADAGHTLAAVIAGAESLPLPGGDADVIVSNFGMIFCLDAPAAFAETARVLAPGGRLLYSAWLPSGPIADVAGLMREAANVTTQPAMPPVARVTDADASQVLWHEPDTFAGLIPGGAAAISVHPAQARFVADSADAWFTVQETHHPMWLTAQRSIEPQDWAEVRAGAIAILEAAAPVGEPFAILSPYVVIEIRPQR